jgi:hypothetical protein
MCRAAFSKPDSQKAAELMALLDRASTGTFTAAVAQHFLGNMSKDGKGLPKDAAAACRWWALVSAEVCASFDVGFTVRHVHPVYLHALNLATHTFVPTQAQIASSPRTSDPAGAGRCSTPCDFLTGPSLHADV